MPFNAVVKTRFVRQQILRVAGSAAEVAVAALRDAHVVARPLKIEEMFLTTCNHHFVPLEEIDTASDSRNYRLTEHGCPI